VHTLFSTFLKFCVFQNGVFWLSFLSSPLLLLLFLLLPPPPRQRDGVRERHAQMEKKYNDEADSVKKLEGEMAQLKMAQGGAVGSLTAYNGLANATANEEEVPNCVLCQVRFPFLSRAGRPAFSFLTSFLVCSLCADLHGSRHRSRHRTVRPYVVL
jgi:hypothetical protein